MNTTTAIVLVIFAYALSVALTMLANRLAYKKADAEVIPVIWYIPGINMLCFFILLIGVAVEMLPKIPRVKIKRMTAQYWKDKWDNIK